jgi:pilus assembly protein CpaE
MPDVQMAPMEAEAAEESPEGRFDRPRLIAFTADSTTDDALREGLTDAVPEGLDIRRGGVKAAVAALRRAVTPHVLIVDLGGEEKPLTALGNLSEVVEPSVRVLAIGDSRDINFYRLITRGMGVTEYLPKPVSRENIARHFAPLLTGQGTESDAVIGGRVVTITGASGGAGATTIAANLAWHFAADARRHTVLLDPDLHRGAAAMLLDVRTGPGLRTALETPDRIDSLFVERAAQPVSAAAVGTRLHVLAGEEKLDAQLAYAPDAAPRLLEELRRRYNLVVADVPFAPVPLYRGLLEHAHQRVVVMEPTLVGIRDTLRLLAMARGPLQSRRPVVVLNRVGRPGSLPRRQVEDALTMKVDVAIPDMPRQLGNAAVMGTPAVSVRSNFRTGITELARLVAFVRLLDNAHGPADAEKPQRRSLFRRTARA